MSVHSMPPGPAKSKLRAFVWRREMKCCYWCRVRLTLRDVTLDHLTLASKGGRHTAGNIVAACEPCNNERGNMPADAWHRLCRARARARENTLALKLGVDRNLFIVHSRTATHRRRT